VCVCMCARAPRFAVYLCVCLRADCFVPLAVSAAAGGAKLGVDLSPNTMESEHSLAEWLATSSPNLLPALPPPATGHMPDMSLGSLMNGGGAGDAAGRSHRRRPSYAEVDDPEGYRRPTYGVRPPLSSAGRGQVCADVCRCGPA
jgi:hypothetical protein